MSVELQCEAEATQALSKDFYLARQPILDRQQQLVAYELLFRRGDVKAADVSEDLHATASVIAHLAELGLEQVVGTSRAFINIDAAALESGILQFLPQDKVMFELLESVEATPQLLASVRAMRAQGFSFALDDVVSADDTVAALLPLASLIKIDILGMPEATLRALTQQLRKPGMQLLAEKVETEAEFELCKELGFDYFQGYYFAKPSIMSGKKLMPSELGLIEILGLIEQDEENSRIEGAIKRDAALSINLLRLVNTPASGSTRRIDTLSQALLLLGQKQLRRWLQILLYTRGEDTAFGSPLLQLATTRARLLELMAERRHAGQRGAAQSAFTVGILSLMDTLFRVPMPELLEQFHLADDVRAALLHRQGPYGDMLAMAEAIEHAKPLPDESQARLGLDADDLYELLPMAFEWSNQIAQSA
jgi:EAL and modified HD-GYP domain-containing signal transduction protein